MNKYLWLRTVLVCTFPLVTLVRARGRELASMGLMVRDYCVNFGEFFFEIDKKENHNKRFVKNRYINEIKKIRSIM